MAQQDRLGWIGLGEMGVHMAVNLQKHLTSTNSNNLTVWNRSQEKAAPLAALGATVAPSVEAVFASANIIFTSLSNDAAVESIYKILFDLARERSEPVIFIETSTIYPTLPTRLKATLEKQSPQHTFLQCPIFGRPPAAAAAQLVWVASGKAEAIAKLSPYFKSMSRTIIDLHTEEVSRASAFKLVGNFFVVGSIELLAEGMNLSEKNGVDQSDLLLLVEQLFPSPVWLGYSKILAEGNTSKTGGFPVSLGLKDVGHIRSMASESGAKLPTADVVHANLTKVEQQGMGNKDWTCIINALKD
ncbi:hypothetical protein BG004_005468 [Podila humilis]|nr:hypothetical protein BG004_005468 [Podila humilis]